MRTSVDEKRPCNASRMWHTGMRGKNLIVVTLLTALIACGREPGPTGPQCTLGPEPPRLTPPVGDIPCPAAAEIDRIEIPISFEANFAGEPLVCRESDGSRDLTVVQKNVYRALLFMREVQFDQPLPWTNESLWAWFRASITGIRIRNDIQFNLCCLPAGTINLLPNPIESTIPNYLEMMVHEARHANGPGHTCGSKDNKIANMGGFGVQYSLMQWLGTHWLDATPQEREYALSRAVYIKWSSFCDECD